MVGVGVLAGELGEQRRGQGEEYEERQDAGGREGPGTAAQAPRDLARGARARGDGPGRGHRPVGGEGHLTETCEMSRTPVQSLMTTFLTSLPTSRL